MSDSGAWYRESGFDTSRTYKHYSARERELILRAYEMGYSRLEIAKAVRRTPTAIDGMLRKEGVKRSSMTGNEQPRQWTTGEDSFLVEHYATVPTRIIARTLDRSTNSVRHRASKLGVHKEGSYNLGEA